MYYKLHMMFLIKFSNDSKLLPIVSEHPKSWGMATSKQYIKILPLFNQHFLTYILIKSYNP